MASSRRGAPNLGRKKGSCLPAQRIVAPRTVRALSAERLGLFANKLKQV
jgi:hypothetical protein